MAYVLLSGKPAFAGQNISEVVYEVVHIEEQPLSSLQPGIPPKKAAAVHKTLNTTAANFLISDSCQEAVVRSSVAASGNRGNEATNTNQDEPRQSDPYRNE
ncbi:MAG: hypothetical protein GY811_06580 [Myxococcales bacterium]|nr:hypothetical protein [Myxococcales bacterium]